MTFLYKIGIGTYTVLAKILALLGHKKARLMLQGRKQTWQQLKTTNHAVNTHKTAWFHCASLGEFEQGRPVLEAFRKDYPQYRIVLTFFSPSGYEARKSYPHAAIICYLPADTPANAQQFIEAIRPNIAFFVKYEFWHFYLKTLHNKQIPVISFASIFRANQVFFKPWGGLMRQSLSYFQHLFVQQEASVKLLKSIDIPSCSVAPDTRFDRVHQICQQPKEIPLASHFSAGTPTLIIGSAWLADIERLAPVLSQWQKPLKIIIAPHEVEDKNIVAIEQQLRQSLPTLRYSQATEENISEASVLLIDNIGMLSSLYQYGDWAYIGGAFGKGLHNTLEAATFGLPIIFGPKYQKFQEAIDLIGLQAAFTIHDSKGFKSIFEELYKQEEFHRKAGQRAQQYVTANLGGTATIINYTSSILTK